jgi:hypothetical protein
MKKWFNKVCRKLFGFYIIVGKTGLAAMDCLEDLESMNKSFKDKLENK